MITKKRAKKSLQELVRSFKWLEVRRRFIINPTMSTIFKASRYFEDVFIKHPSNR